MPIHVQAPDGSTVEFPDGTPDDVMSNAMRQAFGGPQPAAPSPVQQAKDKRDEYYNQGIYAGSMNPLGPIAKAVDAGASAIQRFPLFGFDDEATAAVAAAGGQGFEQARQEAVARRQAQEQQNPTATAVGNVAGALGTAGSMPSLTSRAVSNGANLVRTSLASGADGAIMGALQGAGDAEGGLANRAENALYGGIGGGVMGAATPAALQGLGAVARNVVTPFATNPERTNAVAALAREGVETTAGQRTGSDALRYAEAEIGGQTAKSMMERQGEQFTRAALRRAGADAPRATPEIIDANFNRIGQQFDDLASRNSLIPDRKLAQDLGGAWREYASLVPENQRAPVVMNMIQDLGASMGQGPLDGAAYQAARSRLDRLARGAATDPQLQDALYGIRNALDDGMERTLRQTNPQDLGHWQRARREYRNMLTLEKAATAAGENAAQGLISPSSLRNATINTQGRRNYARGSGDFAELARSGEAVLKPMPNSGTAGRLNAQNLGLGLAGLMGAGAGTATGDPQNAVLGAAAGFLAPRVAGRVMMTGPMQRLLSNQLAANVHWTPAQRAQVMRLLGLAEADQAPQVGKSVVNAIAR